jgi:hypothetical protein
MSLDPADPPRQPGTPSEDDLPPTGEEAQSERRQTVTPLIWLALGLVAIALFIVALVILHGVAPLPSPGK